MSGMREDKVPALKLTMIQYVIVAILACAAHRAMAAAGSGRENYHDAGRGRTASAKCRSLRPRASLFDREGRLLVDNYPSVSCFLVATRPQIMQADLPIIARGLNMTVDQIEATLNHYRAGAEVSADSAEAGYHAG